MWNPTVALGRSPTSHRLPAARWGRLPVRRRLHVPVGWPSGCGSAPSCSPPGPASSTCAGSSRSAARAGGGRRWRSCSRRTSCSTPGASRSSSSPGPACPWMVAFAVLALRRGGWRYPASSPSSWRGQRHQRQLHHLRRRRAGAVAPLCRRSSSARPPGAAPAWPCDGAPHPLVLPWWIVGLEVEAAYGVDVLKYTETVPSTSPRRARRGHPRARLLVLLRRRPPRPWTESPSSTPSSSGCSPLSYLVPCWPSCRRLRPLAAPGLLRPARRRRRRPLRRRPPITSPTPCRRRPQDLHDRHHGRAGHALDRPGDPAGRPRPGHAARGRRHCPVGPAARVGLVDRSWWWPPSSSPTTRPSSTATPSAALRPAGQAPRLPDGRPSTTSNATHPGPASSPSPATTSPPTAGATPSTRPSRPY